MRAAIRQKSEAQEKRREEGILRFAHATRFDAVTDDESAYASRQVSCVKANIDE
jgi:hypothetical protein